MRHGRRGFTLIEILITIGIIMVLVALLVVGYRHLNQTAASRETKAELHVVRSMLQEYENRTGLAGIEFLGPQSSAVAGAPAPGVFPVFVDPASSLTAGATGWPSLALIQLGGDMGDKSNGGQRYGNAGKYAVDFTRDVMFMLMKVPANRSTALAIQSKRILEPPSGGTPPPIDSGPVLLDGWGNPIIFVPRGGLHVWFTDPTNSSNKLYYLVRSTGTSQLTSATGPDPAMTGNERPFWASAGQDGDFRQGEDNVYSFQD